MANSKLTGLSATTTPVSTDIFYIVTDPGGTPTSLKVTGANMGKALTMVGKVTVTQPASSATLTLLDGRTNAFTSSASIPKYSTDTTGAVFEMVKARGTGTTTIVTGDVLGDINFYGHDGSNSLNMARIRAVSAGTIASTRVPTALEFYTATNAAPSVLTKAMTLGTDQSATFVGDITTSRSAAGGTGVFVANVSNSGQAQVKVTNDVGGAGYLKSYGSALGVASLAGKAAFGADSSIVVFGNGNNASGGSSTISLRPGGYDDETALFARGKLTLTGIANTNILASTGYSITGSGTTSMINLAGTLNTSGVTDVIKVDITNTASGAGSTLLNLKVGGVSKVSADMAGAVDAVSYKVGGVAGASFGPGAVTSITVVNGIITSIS